MSLYGNSRPTTPGAVALAAEAVTYTNAFAMSTWTRPSVTTMLTSLLPSTAAALNRWGRLDESVPYLPEIFRDEGWKTAAFVSNGNLFDDRLGFRRGVDVFHLVLHARTGEWHATAIEVVEPVLKFIEAQASPHFFLYVHVVDTHAPYKLEPPYSDLYSGDESASPGIPLDYDRSARQADDQFSRLMEALKAKGFWRNSTVVYTADHGEEFQEHGGSAHGFTIYEEQLRVPLVIKYPQGEEGGSRRPDPVSLADVTPTLADLHKLPASPNWIGTSLWRRRLPAEREIYATEDLDEHRLYGLRRGPLKLIVRLYPTFDRTLFHLDRDPHEQAGVEIPCGAAGVGERDMLDALSAWRQRDAVAYPSLQFDSDASQPGCRATVDLSKISKPFLTAEESCRWATKIESGRLVLAKEAASSRAERLRISSDDRGFLPGVSFASSEGRCSVVAVKSRFLRGPMSEEYLEQLRSLGYLGGE